MGKELISYSEARFWRGICERQQKIIDVCSRRNEIDAKANEICMPYGLNARMVYAPTTGVKGDEADYGCVIEINGENIMNYGILEEISSRIINEIKGITRVVIFLSGTYQMK